MVIALVFALAVAASPAASPVKPPNARASAVASPSSEQELARERREWQAEVRRRLREAADYQAWRRRARSDSTP